MSFLTGFSFLQERYKHIIRTKDWYHNLDDIWDQYFYKPLFYPGSRILLYSSGRSLDWKSYWEKKTNNNKYHSYFCFSLFRDPFEDLYIFGDIGIFTNFILELV